jgi:hypothetical protein
MGSGNPFCDRSALQLTDFPSTDTLKPQWGLPYDMFPDTKKEASRSDSSAEKTSLNVSFSKAASPRST